MQMITAEQLHTPIVARSFAVEGIAFRLTDRKGSSERLGNCEACNREVASVYHLVSMRRYTRPARTDGVTFESGISKFGHKECLVSIIDNMESAYLSPQ